MTPLLMTSLAVALPSRVGLINVGGEGQLYMGAWLATAGALSFPDLPSWLLLPLMTVLGFAGGALWALGPALMRAAKARQRDHLDAAAQLCRAADRQLFHLRPLAKRRQRRLSAVAGLRRGGAAAELRRHAHSPRLAVRPRLSRDLRRGDDPHALGPRDAGDRGQSRRRACGSAFPFRATMIVAMMLAGGMAGLAGMAEVSAIQGRLVASLSPGYGFTGFLVAWLAGGDAIGIVVMAFLFAVVSSVGDILQITQATPYAVINLLMALVLFIVLGQRNPTGGAR